MNIVLENTGEMKSIAKKHLDGFWGKVTLTALIFIFLNDYIPIILTKVTPESLMITFQGMSSSYIASLYETLTMPAFMVGICSFLLAFLRYKDTNPGQIFDGFGYFFKSFGLMIVVGFFTFAWSLLFVIPGIIAVFSYSQAFYILAENPKKGIMQCIRESKTLMRGNKSKYFMLNLSFFGWFFLLAIAQTLAVQSGISDIITDIVFIVPSAILYGYVGVTETVFFELLNGNMKGKRIDNIMDQNINNMDDNYTEIR